MAESDENDCTRISIRYVRVHCTCMCSPHVSLFLSKSPMRLYFFGVLCPSRCVELTVCTHVQCVRPRLCAFFLFYFSAKNSVCESKGGTSFFSRKRRSTFDALPPPKHFYFLFFFGCFFLCGHIIYMQ